MPFAKCGNRSESVLRTPCGCAWMAIGERKEIVQQLRGFARPFARDALALSARAKVRRSSCKGHRGNWRARRDSNSRPSGSKPDALIQLSYGRANWIIACEPGQRRTEKINTESGTSCGGPQSRSFRICSTSRRPWRMETTCKGLVSGRKTIK